MTDISLQCSTTLPTYRALFRRQHCRQPPEQLQYSATPAPERCLIKKYKVRSEIIITVTSPGRRNRSTGFCYKILLPRLPPPTAVSCTHTQQLVVIPRAKLRTKFSNGYQR